MKNGKKCQMRLVFGALKLSNRVQHRSFEDSITWGVAYRIPDDQVEQVTAHLDFREKVKVLSRAVADLNRTDIPNNLLMFMHLLVMKNQLWKRFDLFC